MRREPELCSRCGKCQKVCPVDGALDLEKNRFKGCLVCGRCLDNCPVPGCLKLTAGGLAISESHSQGTSVAG
ncbi:MAG: 4Fe-4S dicluster domain-containing protein [Deltaproteobacteria bacterium]|nr:4Fe-4S dicluster domain-containing protein [Deltaproteobacteria bacterium]